VNQLELFLNLLWLFMAAGAVGLWRTRWLRQKRESRREPVREWTAMACALVLLFFAVSLTDDLRSEAMLLEDSSAGRRQSISTHHPQQAKRVIRDTGPAKLPQTSEIVAPRFGCGIVSQVLNPLPIPPRQLYCGRAPPSVILEALT
jgi:hypothetical protein